MESIFDDIRAERKAQDEKWGQQNRPVLDEVLADRGANRMTEEYEIPSEARAKFLCTINEQRDTLTWVHILVEELSEVASCGHDLKHQREELVQVAAVAVAAIENLDRIKG